MPLSELQRAILCLLARNRDPESFGAGAAPSPQDGPRYSSDIDIFHDREERVAAAADLDAALLTDAGFEVQWLRREVGIHTAAIARDGKATRLEWVRNSDFRFFPAVPIDAADISRRLKTALREPETFIRAMPVGKEGLIFLLDGVAVAPDPSMISHYEEHAGRRGGYWPSSSEIGQSMLDAGSGSSAANN